MDPNNRLNALIAIAGRLIDLLERENEALRSHKTDVIHTLLDEKATLARVYESRYKGLADKTETLNETDPALREELRQGTEKLEVLIKENSKLLEFNIEANRRVVDLIAEAVKAEQPSAGTYSSNAQTSNQGANAASQRIALSLDQTL